MSASAGWLEWRERVESELAGASFERLRTTTADGIALEPLYLDGPAPESAPGQAPFVRGARAERGWWIAQRIETDDPAAANRAALQDLTGGANAVRLVPQGGSDPGPWLERALDGVFLDAIGLILEVAGDPRPWLAGLDRVAAARGLDSGALAGSVVWPLTVFPDAVLELLARPGALRTVTVDLRPQQARGATPADLLGEAVAATAELLQLADAAGVSPTRAASRIGWATAVGAEVFEGIATLRSARMLWSLLLRGAGVEPPPPFLDVSTSPRSLARVDAWTNVLRGTTEAFAAICGGADAVEVWPLDARLDRRTELGRRIARNTQTVLAEEGGLGRVLDPAGGSYYLETLTRDRARAAWQVAQEIEVRGGMRAARPWLDARADEALSRERMAVRRRRRPITGVSEFATLEERAVPGAAAAVSARVPASTRPVAAELEALRAAATGTQPTVMLAALGPLADHGGRLTFMANLLAAGGIATVGGLGTGDQSPDAAARRLAEERGQAGLERVVLCGSDDAYASHGPAAVAALRASGAVWVGVAGKPPCEAALREAGAACFVALGDDVVDYLTEVLQQFGIVVENGAQS